MGNSRPLPRAVRGCWYYFDEPFDDVDPDGERQVVSFRGDGHFRRYDVDDGERHPAGEGEYNFDGDFLILRGRRTETFRVHRPEFWRWDLEGKKAQHTMMRGFVDDGRHRVADDVERDIRMLPLRVRVDADFEGADVIHLFVYEGADDDRRIATFSVEEHGDKALWIGIAPLVRGIAPPVWQRLVSESYLDAYCDEPSDVGEVAVMLFDERQSLAFEYSS